MAVRNLDEHWSELQVVEIDERLAKRAGELTRTYALRAADAIHLASAEVIVELSPDEVLFGCWDRRLWEAAGSVGFQLAPRAAAEN